MLDVKKNMTSLENHCPLLYIYPFIFFCLFESIDYSVESLIYFIFYSEHLKYKRKRENGPETKNNMFAELNEKLLTHKRKQVNLYIQMIFQLVFNLYCRKPKIFKFFHERAI